MSGSFGKSSSTSNPVLTQEQRDQIAATTGFLTQNIIPSYANAVQGAADVYNSSSQGIQNAGQNLAGVAGQVQNVSGETGESALRSGISGLQSLFSPDYEANQVAAALAPAQAQYEQNIQNQRANFGGSGNLGSARQALADRQLAGQSQAIQAKTAADIQSNVAGQRAAAATNLAQLGQGGLTQALGAAGTKVGAAGIDQDTFAKYASVIFGTPATSYTGNFTGAQGKDTSSIGGSVSGSPFKFM